tara:strand:- start:590 stop:913 length:324 start_codon:yes stop_codon:yes gene_type:complete
MSIINKLTRAIADRNGNLAKEVIHDDFKFLMHASGKTLSKQDVINWLKSGDVSEKNVRILFENDEVGFKHSIVTFKDGNTEAVMSYFKFKDGKVIRQETGATKIPKK